MKRICLAFILLACQCREKYEIGISSPVTGYLVVEGFIVYGDSTIIQLSRTSPLSERGIIPERNAIVLVEGEDNTVFPLPEREEGKYSGGILPLNGTTAYRLHIKTQNGKEYTSESSPVIFTPAIDSISWQRKNGVQIFVHSHDPQNNTLYYKWDYDETWEFHSVYHTNVTFTYNVLPNGDKFYTGVDYFDPARKSFNDSLYNCWGSNFSHPINIGSTINLSGDVVYMPLRYFNENAWELSELYSIYVKQFGLNKDAYEFFKKMKKNTESLGSIFDAQPSELKGNIHCTTDSSEQVIGFVEACSVTNSRIFISNKDLPGWRYEMKCREPNNIGANTPYDVLWNGVNEFQLPVGVHEDNSGNIISFSSADRNCVDCRLRGSPIRPSYWP